MVVSLIIALLFGFWGYKVAPSKNRKPTLWAVDCFLLPLISIICLYVAKPADSPENDKLGKILLIIGIILFVIGFIIGCTQGILSAI